MNYCYFYGSMAAMLNSLADLHKILNYIMKVFIACAAALCATCMDVCVCVCLSVMKYSHARALFYYFDDMHM